MELKRIYRRPDGWEADRNTSDPKRVSAKNPKGLKDPSRDEGVVLNPPPIDHFEVKHTGNHAEQNFSEKMVQAGISEGFATVSRGKLTLHCEPEDLVYTIVRGPGYYCCYCGQAIPDAGAFVKGEDGEESKRTVGMVHVETIHGGKVSPDPSNPSGYRRLNGYECVLDEKLQKRYGFEAYRKKRLAPAPKEKTDG